MDMDIETKTTGGAASIAAPGQGSARHDTNIETIDVEAVNSPTRRSNYKKREPIYPKRVQGKFRLTKWVVMAVTLAVYYLTPWLRWTRPGDAPDQAVLIDFEGPRFYFFFIEIWPQEIYFVTGLLILSALALFLFTALFGRVWCGYACPQTVWTDLFLFVERRVEGDRNARIKLAKEPLSMSKIGKKLTKHTIWLLISAATGGAWIFYFHDAPTVFGQLFTGEAPATAYIFLGLLTFTTYALAGTMREQVCTYMCPWPRIQAAMIDEDTLSVAYRSGRGEPRGPHKKDESWDGRGDCVDCKQCVAACPMGIDIRDGAQLECINCALCVDACNSIMDRIGRPQGLIDYDTDINAQHKGSVKPMPFKPIRPRTIFYGVVLTFTSALMLYGLMTRSDLDVNVLHDRNPTFVRLSDGSIRNAYTVRLLNKTHNIQLIKMTVESNIDPIINVIGQEGEGSASLLELKTDRARSLRVLLKTDSADLRQSSTPINFIFENTETGEKISNPSMFLSGNR